MVAGIGAAAVERGFLLELNTKGVGGGGGGTSGTPGDTAAWRGADRQNPEGQAATPCEMQGIDLVLSSGGA